jgi:hypothetical protein
MRLVPPSMRTMIAERGGCRRPRAVDFSARVRETETRAGRRPLPRQTVYEIRTAGAVAAARDSRFTTLIPSAKAARPTMTCADCTIQW